jgi:hypothetical protein
MFRAIEAKEVHMEPKDLVPRLLLFGGLTAAVVLYSRRRQGQFKQVTATASDVTANIASTATSSATTVVERGRQTLETLLDSVAEQALKELKAVLKDGLKRIEAMVDEL